MLYAFLYLRGSIFFKIVKFINDITLYSNHSAITDITENRIPINYNCFASKTNIYDNIILFTKFKVYSIFIKIGSIQFD